MATLVAGLLISKDFNKKEEVVNKVLYGHQFSSSLGLREEMQTILYVYGALWDFIDEDEGCASNTLPSKECVVIDSDDDEAPAKTVKRVTKEEKKREAPIDEDVISVNECSLEPKETSEPSMKVGNIVTEIESEPSLQMKFQKHRTPRKLGVDPASQANKVQKITETIEEVKEKSDDTYEEQLSELTKYVRPKDRKYPTR